MDRAATRPDPAAWRALARAVTGGAGDLIVADRRAAGMVAAIWRRATRPSIQCDAMVTGRIGSRDLSRGCFSFAEAWTMAGRDLVRTGRDHEAEGMLRSGSSVRDLLRRFYGIVMTEIAYDDAAEARAFRRTLKLVPRLA